MHNFIGRDGSDPRSLRNNARQELQHYGVELVDDLVVDARAVEAEPPQTLALSFTVTTQRNLTFHGRKLLFATGMCDDLPRIPGVGDCYGISVHHCPYCDGWQHRDTHLLSCGSDTKAAVGLALSLRGWSRHVTLLADGQSPDANDRYRLQRNGIHWREEKIAELVHHHGVLTEVKLEGGIRLVADALFFNTGQRTHCDLPKSFGCSFDAKGQAETSRHQKTSRPGVFIAGDADGDVQFVIVAAAEGATAALAINRELQDEDRGESQYP